MLKTWKWDEREAKQIKVGQSLAAFSIHYDHLAE
jgi:hypothetical protein